MKKTLAGLGIILGLVGCNPTQPTVINNTNTNTNNITNGGLTDPNAVATACLPTEEQPIRVDVSAPDSVAVGGSAGIDATPKSANGKRSDGCNVLQGIAWSALPVAVCHVKEPAVFNTAVVCDARGTCQLTATVPGKGAFGSSSVACQ